MLKVCLHVRFIFFSRICPSGTRNRLCLHSLNQNHTPSREFVCRSKGQVRLECATFQTAPREPKPRLPPNSKFSGHFFDMHEHAGLSTSSYVGPGRVCSSPHSSDRHPARPLNRCSTTRGLKSHEVPESMLRVTLNKRLPRGYRTA